MRHALQMEGFGVRLRPVQMDDAAFIVWLRHQDYVTGRVGDTASDAAGQRKWLESYFERDGDYYFVVETPGGIPLGTIGLYGITGTQAEWGRYVIRQEVLAALPSAMLIFDLAFVKLNLHELLASCVSTNVTMHSFLKKCGFRRSETKLANQIIGGKPVDLLHFVLTAADWPERRRRLFPLAEFVRIRINKWEKCCHKTEVADGVGHQQTGIIYGLETMSDC